MSPLRRALRALIELFVEDGFVAAAAVAWIAMAAFLLPRLIAANGVRAFLLFIGLAAVLVASTLRRAGREQT